MLRIDPGQFGEFVYCEGRCLGGVVKLSGLWDLHIPALNQALLGAFGAFPNPHPLWGGEGRRCQGLALHPARGRVLQYPAPWGLPKLWCCC